MYELYNFIGCALQGSTKLFQGIHSDGFVSLQIGDGIGAEAQLIDQRIGGNAPVFHGLPQRLIAYHIYTTLS